MISDRDLDSNASPAQIKQGASLWFVFFWVAGLWALISEAGIWVAFGVSCIAAAAYFAAVHTIYNKIEHFKAAVKLWNEVERLRAPPEPVMPENVTIREHEIGERLDSGAVTSTDKPTKSGE